MTEAFIYITGRLPYALDEIEDAVDDALDGRGEVTGTGSGKVGSNIDVTIDGEPQPAEVLAILREALAEFSLPGSTTVVIAGERFAFYD